MMSSEAPQISVMSNREHILNRPDTYLGNSVYGSYSVNTVNENGKIVRTNVFYNPAFEQTVIEIGSNCVDNVWRSSKTKTPCSEIRFEYFKDGSMCFYNDGLTIPIVLSKIKGLEGLYNPSIVFSVLMSSSNYNDSEMRRSSGRNGLGSKIVNVMSKFFTVETQDGKNHFTQTWYDNMSRQEDPKVVKMKDGKGFTKITWLPDYKRFGMVDGLTPSVLSVIKRYLYDIAMVTGVRVFFNGEQIKINNLVDYAMSFEECSDCKEYVSIKTANSNVVLVPSGNVSVAFTNGIPNADGGVHVEAWSKAIFGEVASKLSSENSKITSSEVRGFFSLFVSCSLDNPSFTNQEKSKLTAPKPDTILTPANLNKILKWNVITSIKNLMSSKLLRAQKKKLEGVRRTHPNVKKLEDANYAGTSKSGDCILIYCEGDSAKTFAVAGIERGIGEGKSLKQGRDYFGILPCGGKILNVRKADATKIGDNEGIQMLIRSLGLEIGVDYTLDFNFRRLRYGNLMIITDADDDGIHIEGLCHNFFHTLFPTILQRKESFIISMKTPLVRVSLKDGTELKFYRQQAFKQFQEKSGHLIKNRPRHFKGLGTSDDRAVIDCFGQRLVHYEQDNEIENKMQKAFDRDQTTARKEWVIGYDQSLPNEDEFDEKSVNVKSTSSKFIDNELIVYSVANCARSLPHVMDGLKESQRKILYTVLEQKLTYDKPSKKVYRLSGEVGSNTEYVHGEQCLWDTITGMAWDFVGSNNIPLLVPDGQFGSRLAMGKDASNARYINTRQQEIIPYIFRPEDLPILNYIQGEDMTIEPTYYVPIVPLILINGIRGGIGTGFSSRVPAFNPIDVVKCIRIWIDENLSTLTKTDIFTISDFPQIDPWYQGFTGEIKLENGSYTSYGIVKKGDEEGVVEITELPIGLSVDKFREKLISLREEGKIKDYKDYCSKTRVHFIVYEGSSTCSINNLKLTTSLPITNMVAFGSDGKIKHYKNVDEIIYEFAQTRLEWYVKRKEYTLNTLKKQLQISSAKRRFVEEIITDQIVVYRRKKAEIIETLEERKYPQFEEKYDYLLKMSIDSFTEDLIHKLDGVIERLNADITKYENTTTRQMWLNELTEFEEAYRRYQARWQENENILNCAKNRKSTSHVKRRLKK